MGIVLHLMLTMSFLWYLRLQGKRLNYKNGLLQSNVKF